MDSSSTPAAVPAQPSSLPSISDLISASWAIFTKKVFTLILVDLLTVLAVVVVVIVAVLVGLGLGLTHISLTTLGGPILIAGIILAILIAISLIIIFTISAAASAFIIADEAKLSVGDAIKKSFPVILPIIIVGVLTALLVFGGLFVLVIPGIVIYFLLYFSYLEVILGNKRSFEALRGSYNLVSHYFWQVVLRILVLSAIYLIVDLIMGELKSILLLELVNFLLGIFSTIYIITLYKQLVAITAPYRSSLNLISVIALIGWIIIILLVVVFGNSAFSNLNKLKSNPAPLPVPYNNYSNQTPISTPSGNNFY